MQRLLPPEATEAQVKLSITPPPALPVVANTKTFDYELQVLVQEGNAHVEYRFSSTADL